MTGAFSARRSRLGDVLEGFTGEDTHEFVALVCRMRMMLFSTRNRVGRTEDAFHGVEMSFYRRHYSVARLCSHPSYYNCIFNINTDMFIRAAKVDYLPRVRLPLTLPNLEGRRPKNGVGR